MKRFKSLGVIALCGVLAACAMEPKTIVQKPLTTYPAVPQPGPNYTGGIFHTGAYRPLFEDHRGRMVGDIITMTIAEKTTAGKSAAASDTKSGAVSFAAPTVFGVPSTTTAKASLNATSANKFSDAGAITSSNNFTGTMGLTVIDVLPNGNLVVAGEKQIALDRSAEFIRFSGVVNPDSIVNNTVSSTQVADARVEYRTNSRYDTSEVMSELARFVMSIAPF